MIEIPGFQNLEEFSTAHEDLITKCLGNWQLFDGAVLFSWINALAGKHNVSPEKLRQLMDEIYEEVHDKNRIAYVKLAIPGPDAHAWLIPHMRADHDDDKQPSRITGYTFTLLDSNEPCWLNKLTYREGMTCLPGSRACVPYLQRSGDFERYRKAIEAYPKS